MVVVGLWDPLQFTRTVGSLRGDHLRWVITGSNILGYSKYLWWKYIGCLSLVTAFVTSWWSSYNGWTCGSLSRLKTRKADGILPELVLWGGPVLFERSLVEYKLFGRRVVCSRIGGMLWLYQFPKKGDFLSCDNWWGISLLDVVGKFFVHSIQDYLQVGAEGHIANATQIPLH